MLLNDWLRSAQCILLGSFFSDSKQIWVCLGVLLSEDCKPHPHVGFPRNVCSVMETVGGVSSLCRFIANLNIVKKIFTFIIIFLWEKVLESWTIILYMTLPGMILQEIRWRGALCRHIVSTAHSGYRVHSPVSRATPSSIWRSQISIAIIIHIPESYPLPTRIGGCYGYQWLLHVFWKQTGNFGEVHTYLYVEMALFSWIVNHWVCLLMICVQHCVHIPFSFTFVFFLVCPTNSSTTCFPWWLGMWTFPSWTLLWLATQTLWTRCCRRCYPHIFLSRYSINFLTLLFLCVSP